jgi:hypothetical protein
LKALIQGEDPALKATYDEVIRYIADYLDSDTIIKTPVLVTDMNSDANERDKRIDKALGGISSVCIDTAISTGKTH